MRFIDGVLISYLAIAAMLLLLIIGDRIAGWLEKMRERDRERKRRAV